MITFGIVVATMIVSILAFRDRRMLENMMFNPHRILRGNQWHRFITGGFIHADWFHLLINMFVLYVAGSRVEEYFLSRSGLKGAACYLLLYFLSMILSVVPTFIKKKNYPGYNALGASGAVSGVLFTGILFEPFTPLCLFFMICLPGFVMGIAYLAYSWFAAKKESVYINHDAHFWGAVSGVLFTIAIYPGVAGNFVEEVCRHLNL